MRTDTAEYAYENDCEEDRHDGENIKHIRRILGISQIDLSERIHIGPTQLNRIERLKIVDDETLDRIAAELGVTSEFIKKYNHEATVNTIISNNTFTDESSISKASNGNSSVGTRPNNTVENINPLDTIKEIYEKLLTEKDERIALLEKELDELRK